MYRRKELKMSKVTFDYSKAKTFIADHEIESMKKIAENAKAELLGREGAGNDFLGWIDLMICDKCLCF